MYNFFMNCYHLKDWLKMNDKIKFSDVENLFDENNGNFYMKICADLCNGIKHMVADRRSRLDENMKIERGSLITVPLTANIIANSENIKNPEKIKPVGVRSELVCWVSVNNKTYNVFDIATQCMDKWDKYLKDKNAI